jgi:hypothetical protein
VERPRYLIYCEGRRTEVRYFQDVRTDLRASTVEIVIGREHKEPLGLVQAAIEHQRQAPNRQKDGYEAYDQVWCVFDVEAPRPHPRLADALRLARKYGVQCAVSNPCFELWVLLHFREPPGYLTSKQASRHVEACDCGYSREAKQVDYDVIRDKRLDAYDRAARLDQRHREPAKAVGRNPWTSVHLLVDALFKA